MKLSRYVRHNKNVKTIVLLIMVFFVIGIGYSYLTTNLSISGNVVVEKKRLFPTQIENIIENDTCMYHYTGPVTDEELYTLINNNSLYYDVLNKTNARWWGLSPHAFNYDAIVCFVYTDGSVECDNYVDDDDGIRLVVSLATGVIISSGTGSEADPFIISE